MIGKKFIDIFSNAKEASQFEQIGENIRIQSREIDDMIDKIESCEVIIRKEPDEETQKAIYGLKGEIRSITEGIIEKKDILSGLKSNTPTTNTNQSFLGRVLKNILIHGQDIFKRNNKDK